MVRIRELTTDDVQDLDALLGTDEVADRCRCMWFIVRVKDFHEAGRSGNRAAFLSLMEGDDHPLGLLAYDDERPVGWCATGPRSRFARIIQAPTLRSTDRREDDTVWFVPCFFIHAETRRRGVAKALLQGAVDLAAACGAEAIEGFPQSGTRTRSRGSNFQTGVESLFETCGFEAVDRPSSNRVIMRRNL